MTTRTQRELYERAARLEALPLRLVAVYLAWTDAALLLLVLYRMGIL